MSVAVVGGGITGLSVAYRLAERGKRPVLYERSPRLGGLVGSFRLGNVRLEKYFHHIFLSDTAIRRVIAEVGLERDLLWRATPMGFYTDGKTFPFDKPADLLRFSALPWADRFRFGYQIWKNGRNPNGAELDDITVKDWVEKEWGERIYSRFWRPLLLSKFGEAADRISAAWLWGRIHARANSRAGGQEKLGYLRGGFVRAMEAVGEKIRALGGEIRLHAEVSKVEKTTDGKWAVRTDAGAELFDTVVLAIPSPALSALCPDIPQDEKAAHAAVAYQAISCMTVVMDRPLSNIYWLNVGDRSIPYAGVIEQTNFIPKEDYGGAHVAYLFNYLPQGHPWLDEPKEKLFERYETGLKKMFPKYSRDQVKQLMIFRDRYATPVYEAGYLKKIPPIASSQKGLYYANTAHIFPHDRNMNFSVELADRVVHELWGHLT